MQLQLSDLNDIVHLPPGIVKVNVTFAAGAQSRQRAHVRHWIRQLIWPWEAVLHRQTCHEGQVQAPNRPAEVALEGVYRHSMQWDPKSGPMYACAAGAQCRRQA